MLAIRLQRVGRKGYATYRVAVQEAQRHPSSGRVVAYVGSYNPHTKAATIQVEAAQKFLDNGAQPSPRVVKLLADAGVKLPKWVKTYDNAQKATLRNPEKLRKNRPAEEVVVEEVTEAPAEEAEAPAETPAEEEIATEEPAESGDAAEAIVDETTPVDEPAAE